MRRRSNAGQDTRTGISRYRNSGHPVARMTAAASLEAASLARVEWAPSVKTRAELSSQREADERHPAPVAVPKRTLAL